MNAKYAHYIRTIRYYRYVIKSYIHMGEFISRK